MSVGFDERVERLHQMPGRTIYLRLQPGVDVVLGAASPPFSAGNQFEFDYAFGAQRYLYASIQILASFRNEHAHAFFKGGRDFGIAYDLGKMRRADFLFAFAYQHQIYRQLFPRRFESVERAEEGGFRAFLVHRAAAYADSSEAFFLHDLAFEGRRRPLRGIELFYVVHEIDAHGGGRSGVQDTEDPGLARRGDNLHVGESRVTCEFRHVFGTLGIVAVFGGDRGERDPILQPLHVLVMQFGNLIEHRLLIGVGRSVCGEGCDWQGGDGGSGERAVDEFATAPFVLDRVVLD